MHKYSFRRSVSENPIIQAVPWPRDRRSAVLTKFSRPVHDAKNAYSMGTFSPLSHQRESDNREAQGGYPVSFKACANSMFPFDLLDGPGAEVSERCWWVAYTMVRQEKRLAEDLTRRRIPFYLPLVAREHIYRGRRLQAEIPLFGSYLFLFADAAERLQGLATDRIAQLLPVNDGLKLYEDLRQVRRLIESKMPLTVEARLSPGQRVRVKHGSMAGLEGVVECRRQRTKLIIAVTFLQRGLSVEIEDLMLEPIDGHVSPRPVGAAMC